MHSSTRFSRNYGIPSQDVNEMQRDRKVALFWGCFAALIIPVVMWAMRPRPFSAESSHDLVTLSIKRQMKSPVLQMRVPLDINAPDEDQLREAWLQIKVQMQNQGASSDEADAIVQVVSRESPTGKMPTYAERATLTGQDVWIIADVWQSSSQTMWICPPTSTEMERDRLEKRRYWAAIVGHQAPHRILAIETRDMNNATDMATGNSGDE